MSKALSSALYVSGIDKLLRELNLRTQTARLDLVRFHKYLSVCAYAHEESNPGLSAKYRAAAQKTFVSLDKTNLMGRRWEETLLYLTDLEDAVEALTIFVKNELKERDAKFHLESLEYSNATFGVKYLTRRLSEKLKEGVFQVAFLDLVFSQIKAGKGEVPISLATGENVDDVIKRTSKLKSFLSGSEPSNTNLNEVITCIRVLRSINDATVMG